MAAILKIRFPDDACMFEWLDDMVQAQALPAGSRIRHTDSMDSPAEYILDGGRDGKDALELETTTQTTTRVRKTGQGWERVEGRKHDR